MQVVAKSQTVKFANSDKRYGVEFHFESKDLNIALITINGRYPEKGHLVNEVCKEIIYVINGSGDVGVDEEVHKLNPGDAIFIEQGERYYLLGDNVETLVPCSPAFYPEQHKEVA
jgi:mannose-6-phosphate isomerase-like protein (cupin superfamily)